MKSLTFLFLALPLLVCADDVVYPWDTDPNWQPPSGWGTPAGGWDSVKYPGSQPAAKPSAPAASGGNAQQPSSTSIADAYHPSPSSANAGGGAQPTTTTSSTPPAPTTTSSPAAPVPTGNSGPSGTSCSSGEQSIEIQNGSGKDLIIQAAAPWVVGPCATIADGSSCTFCQARGTSGGNLQLGYGVANGRGTWIEGNWNLDVKWPTLDISYIPGYSVPIVCTGSDGTSTIGLADPLCSDEACSNCESGGGTYLDGACLNPMGDSNTVLVDGPAPEFFSSATDIVYTYPHDDHVGYAPPWNVSKCVTGPQFGSSAGSKRAVEKQGAEAPKAGEKRDARASHLHQHLGRRHAGKRRHGHSHGILGDVKL